MNDYDTRFVNTMSAALRRRFTRVSILPPLNGADNLSSLQEAEFVFEKVKTQPTRGIELDDFETAWGKVKAVEDDIKGVFGFFRGNNPRPLYIGTAQLEDVIRSAADRMHFMPAIPVRAAIDSAFESKVISSLETDGTRMILTEDFVTKLSETFPWLSNSSARLHSFFNGTL